MKSTVQNLAFSACAGLLLILPLISLEIVNRRQFNEEFPVVLFFGIWQLAAAIIFILLPLARARRAGRQSPGTNPGGSPLARPVPSALISIAIFLVIWLFIWLDSRGWAPLQRLINGPDPGQEYLPGLFFTSAIFWLAVAAAVTAGAPVARTLRDGGTLFAHPLHLTIVILFITSLVFGLANLVVDQWPCFMGVPVCD